METHKKVTFSHLMIVEALNSAYPDLNIGPGAELFTPLAAGIESDNRRLTSPITFEWEE